MTLPHHLMFWSARKRGGYPEPIKARFEPRVRDDLRDHVLPLIGEVCWWDYGYRTDADETYPRQVMWRPHDERFAGMTVPGEDLTLIPRGIVA